MGRTKMSKIDPRHWDEDKNKENAIRGKKRRNSSKRTRNVNGKRIKNGRF